MKCLKKGHPLFGMSFLSNQKCFLLFPCNPAHVQLRTLRFREDLDLRDPELQYLLALCLRDGRGVPKDPKKFLELLKIAVKNGSLWASIYLDALNRGTGEEREKERETILFLTRIKEKK